ncbi:MAG TPA: amino acid permease, partial [Acetobacteraceae bacterium]|nr:amino acid permease [Acetobacteraceae bacterium]
MPDRGSWARKPVADIVRQAEAPRLARTLGPVSIVAIGIGAIVGAGIFVLTGTAAAQYAGPGIMLSFVLASLACGFVGLCYAELASMLPVSGSTYAYTYAAIGELPAWMIGWDLILEYTMGAATVASGWSGYAVNLLHSWGVTVPASLTASPGTLVTAADGTAVRAICNLPAAAIVLLLTLLLVRGTRDSSRFNNTMVAIKLSVVVAFIAVGAFHVDPANWQPLIPPNSGEFGHYGWSGILRGASVVFFAFLGFDTVSTTAQEATRPQRDVPIGILGSLSICTLLYIGVSAVLTGLVPYPQLDVADPIAKGVDAIGLPWFAAPIKLAAITGLTTVILVLLYGQGRILFAMSGDGLLPPVFATVHPRRRTPYLSQIAIGLTVAALAALVPINVLGEMVSI